MAWISKRENWSGNFFWVLAEPANLMALCMVKMLLKMNTNIQSNWIINKVGACCFREIVQLVNDYGTVLQMSPTVRDNAPILYNLMMTSQGNFHGDNSTNIPVLVAIMAFLWARAEFSRRCSAGSGIVKKEEFDVKFRLDLLTPMCFMTHKCHIILPKEDEKGLPALLDMFGPRLYDNTLTSGSLVQTIESTVKGVIANTKFERLQKLTETKKSPACDVSISFGEFVKKVFLSEDVMMIDDLKWIDHEISHMDPIKNIIDAYSGPNNVKDMGSVYTYATALFNFGLGESADMDEQKYKKCCKLLGYKSTEDKDKTKVSQVDQEIEKETKLKKTVKKPKDKKRKGTHTQTKTTAKKQKKPDPKRHWSLSDSELQLRSLIGDDVKSDAISVEKKDEKLKPILPDVAVGMAAIMKAVRVLGYAIQGYDAGKAVDEKQLTETVNDSDVNSTVDSIVRKLTAQAVEQLVSSAQPTAGTTSADEWKKRFEIAMDAVIGKVSPPNISSDDDATKEEEENGSDKRGSDSSSEEEDEEEEK